MCINSMEDMLLKHTVPKCTQLISKFQRTSKQRTSKQNKWTCIHGIILKILQGVPAKYIITNLHIHIPRDNKKNTINTPISVGA